MVQRKAQTSGVDTVRVIEKLLVVQDIDIRIRDIEHKLRDIPARKQVELARLEQHKLAVAKAEEQVKGIQVEVKRLALEAESRQTKIAKLRQQQLELKTNREFKTMDGEIGMVEAEIKRLEDRELELMESIDAARRGVGEQVAALKKEDDAVQADIKVLDARAAELNGELSRCNAEREIAASDIDAKWRAYYERVFHRKKDRALVPLEGGFCGGCHMKLPPSIAHATRKDGDMVVCEQCGRLLYS